MKNKKFLFVLGIFLLIAVIVFVLAYRVDPFNNVLINEHGICRFVYHDLHSAIFVPTRTSQEWISFLSFHPPGISFSSCGECITFSDCYVIYPNCGWEMDCAGNLCCVYNDPPPVNCPTLSCM